METLNLIFMSYPDIITKLPHINLPIKGVKSYKLQGQNNQLVFFEFTEEAVIPEHSHKAQWGIVVNGRIDLTIGGLEITYKKGDSYFIPDGVKHSAKIYKGFSAIDFFDQPDRY